MGAIGGLLGTAGGAGGSGFAAPSAAYVQTPVTDQQATDAYNSAQNALNQQNSFLTQIQNQNGLGNQNNVYGELQAVANGQGLNPAQTMLAQSTGANTANQAALMAGQRGSSQNVGLLARQAAMQGAANQQNAVGTAANMQATNSLNAINSQGALANQMVANQAAATQGVVSGTQGEQSNLLNSIAGQNSANVSNQASLNSANAGLANTNMQGQQGLIGGALNAGAGAAKAEGGMITRMADGGPTPSVAGQPQATNGPQSSFGQYLKNFSAGQQASNPLRSGMQNLVSSLIKPNAPVAAGQQTAPPQAPQAAAPMNVTTPNGGTIDLNDPKQTDNNQTSFAQGGKVPAMLSPGERYLPPSAVQKVKQGADPIKEGKKVPGKPKVGGAKNDYANDTVPATLEEGGIVLPRSVTQAKHPHWEAHKFVSAIMAKQGKLK